MIMVPLSLCILLSLKESRIPQSEIKPQDWAITHTSPTPVETASCSTHFTIIRLLYCFNQTNLVEFLYEYPGLDLLSPCIWSRSIVLSLDPPLLSTSE